MKHDNTKSNLLEEVINILEINGYSFIDCGYYEHDDIIPLSFQIGTFDNKICVMLADVDNFLEGDRYYFSDTNKAFRYIEKIRKQIKSKSPLFKPPTKFLFEKMKKDEFSLLEKIINDYQNQSLS